MDEDGGEAELLSGVLSLSLTEAHGDPKTYERNVHETMAGFPDLRERRLKDYERIFTLVGADDTARTRRRKARGMEKARQPSKFNSSMILWRRGRTLRSQDRSGQIQECSHQCLVLIDELRELVDRLMAWLTLCLPANDHPLSVSHRRKLKQFKSRLRNEAKRLEGQRQGVTLAHSSHVKTIRSMFLTKDVADYNLAGWETAHHELLVMQVRLRQMTNRGEETKDSERCCRRPNGFDFLAGVTDWGSLTSKPRHATTTRMGRKLPNRYL
ncbi:unnamed protein product [Scytosiphon promiscuus]